MKSNKAPLIFIIYNRPDLTAISLNVIREYKPNRIYVVADGPKNDKDKYFCDQTRALIDTIDWDCEIYKNYAKGNLGCGVRPATGISWAFETCDRAIILEDDCVPDPSFFSFCEVLLEKYKDVPRVGYISGTQYLEKVDGRNSYYFSYLPHPWGWATWKRTWDNYDFYIRDWPKYRNLFWLLSKSGSLGYAKQRMKFYDSVYGGKKDIWDFQFTFMLWKNYQLNITPCVNLVSNIGFGNRATHTKSSPSHQFSNIPTKTIEFPLKHPKIIMRNLKRDYIEGNQRLGSHKSFLNKIQKYSKKALSKVYKRMFE